MVYNSANRPLHGRSGVCALVNTYPVNYIVCDFSHPLKLQNVILYEKSDQLDRFVTLPQPLHFKVYLFNVTNVDRILAGELPRVKQIGPYVFRCDNSILSSSSCNKIERPVQPILQSIPHEDHSQCIRRQTSHQLHATTEVHIQPSGIG